MNVVIGENKLGHTPEILSMGGYFDRSRYAVDSLVMQLKAEGATFESNSTLVVEPSNIHLVNLIHISEHEFGRENDSLSFPFSASTESNVADEGELIEIFLGSNAKWEKGGYLACDCKYTWYKVEFHLKGWEVITVEVDPCGEGFQEAIRVIQEKAFTLHLSPAHSRKLRDYFAPLVENQRKIRAATKGGSDPCSE